MPRLPTSGFMTTTSIAIDGYDVVQTYGVVRGIVVRSRSVLGQMGVKFQTFFGGNITLLEELCESTRAEAFSIKVRPAMRTVRSSRMSMRVALWPTRLFDAMPCC